MKSKNIISEDKFKSKWGFIISCIGSSVGMANIWLFPYRAGEFGGAAFLIPYILFVVLIGFTGVIGEMAFGRAMQSGPLGAIKKAFEYQIKGLGFSFVEVIAACPTGWKLKPVQALEYIKNEVTKVHKLGIFKDLAESMA